jgi:hypothetical protein
MNSILINAKQRTRGFRLNGGESFANNQIAIVM